MKRTFQYFSCAMVVCSIVFSSCAKKDSAESEHHEAVAEEKDVEWKEMDDFHKYMADAFHPYKDSMNLAPAKLYADSMVVSAEKWISAPLPERVNNDTVKLKLQALKAGTVNFAQVAKGSDDKQTGESLTKLHDLFHEVQGLWYGGKGHGHHHEH